ncbi:MAG TPA: sulfatase-like hydrolase/transferase, partial [Pirellulales bacterium]
LILFFSDNGAHALIPNNDAKYPDAEQYPAVKVGSDNAPLRGFKSSVYEGGIRSPTIVSWPGHLQPGVLDAPLHTTDWMPTLTRLIGYQPPRDLKWDGLDIWPMLTATASAGEPRTLYCLGSNRRDQIVRRGPWKLITHTKGPPELYNLADDIGESHNLADDRPELVADLQRRLTVAAARDNECKVHDPSAKQ